MKREIQFQHPGKEKQLESTRYNCSHSLGVLFQVDLARPEKWWGERRLHALPWHIHTPQSWWEWGGGTPPFYRQGNAGPLSVSWDLDTSPLILTTTFFPTKNTLLHQECTCYRLQLTCPAPILPQALWQQKPSQARVRHHFLEPSQPPPQHTHTHSTSSSLCWGNSFFLRIPEAHGFPASQLADEWWGRPPCLAHTSVAEAQIR